MPDFLQLNVFGRAGAPKKDAQVSVTKDGEAASFHPVKENGAFVFSLERYTGDAAVPLRVTVKPSVEFVVDYTPSSATLAASASKPLPKEVSAIQKLQAASSTFFIPVVLARDVHFLAARFFDRTGRTPAKRRKVEVEGRKAETDDEGQVVLKGMPCRDLEVHFEGGGVALVPAVHDPALVVEVRLRFVEPTKGASPRGRKEKEEGEPAHVFPGGDAAADDGTEAATEGEPAPPRGDCCSMSKEQR